MEPCPSCPCIVSLYSAKSPPPHLLQQTILSFLPFSACSVFSSSTLWNLYKITLLPILHILALHILRTLHSFYSETYFTLLTTLHCFLRTSSKTFRRSPIKMSLLSALHIFSIMYIYLLNSLRSFFCAKISSFKAVQGSTVPVSGQTLRIILYKRDSKNSIERLFARGVK